MAREIRCEAPTGDTCGEGVVWCAEESAVYWTDINRFLIHRCFPERGTVENWQFEEPVVAIALSSVEGQFMVALGSKLIWWWPEGDRREDHGFVLPGSPAVRLNDGRADPWGNFWIGSMRNNVAPDGEGMEAGGKDGLLYRITPDGEVSEQFSDIGISNTIAWSPDHGTFYTADSLANEIYAFDSSPQGISNMREFFPADAAGVPDGSAIDCDGVIWNCRYFGRSILRISPQGDLLERVEMPVRNITTATFGGADLKTLYVTSATAERDKGDRLAGSLWSLRTEVAGLPENRVKVS